MTPPFLALRDNNVAPEILQDFVHLDRLPEGLPVHIQLPYSAWRRTKEV